MSNIDSSSDGNNFDNGFEKLDPFSPTISPQQDDVISSSDYQDRTEDIPGVNYSPPPIGGVSAPVPVGEPLLNFGSFEKEQNVPEVQESTTPQPPTPTKSTSDPTPIATSCTFVGEEFI